MSAKKKQSFLQVLESSPLAGANANYIENMYETYLQDRSAVDDQWASYFDSLGENTTSASHRLSAVRQEFTNFQRKNLQSNTVIADSASNKQVHVLQLINAYRFMGHRAAHFNPLESKPSRKIDELTLQQHDLTQSDLKSEFNTGSLFYAETATLQEIINLIEKVYCGPIGSEYMHITETSEKRWIQEYIEGANVEHTAKERREIFQQLVAAESFERYCHRKYVGQKRFSLEGAESLIPLINEIIACSGMNGIEELAIGMAHRGRLNVLVNVMGKTPSELFMEFEGKATETFEGTGDVKYHKGFSADIKSEGGTVHVALAFNPSHLEIVAPVVEGSVRARQERRNDADGNRVVPIIIHGDAAFAGQGVIMETFNMSQSRGFSTKGTVHIVINNQIGFTTSNQNDARSTLYCTDVAKMVNAPIFHVNGDNPEAVCFIAKLALDYRMKFHKDVVIDLVCYRRHGHSEADEPMATQPMMYQEIRSMDTTLGLYAVELEQAGVLAKGEKNDLIKQYQAKLKEGKSVVSRLVSQEQANYPYDEDWTPYQLRSGTVAVDTQVNDELLQSLFYKISKLPDNFVVHSNVKKILQLREKMIAGEVNVDWGFAEIMAYATLLNDGYSVRLSGQDCGRGTFFHRHAALHNQVDGKVYVPLRILNTEKTKFLVINSLLSEAAVLAFEYGYATTDPHTLTIWEAQFGDFANSAQVVIDQFISAGEQKWNRMCGLVMYLPHGLEGQGPEHSSARLERYLQLCAQQNILVCMPSNASQIFHLIRQQMLQTSRKPLIVMTPKSLLRAKEANSPITDLITGSFKKVIADRQNLELNKVERVILCSGKVYYDLFEHAKAKNIRNTAIIRIEQLYPFPEEELKQAFSIYPQVKDFVWCQEEAQNQGSWYTSRHHIVTAIGDSYHLHYAGRPHLAAPAVGLLSLHKKQLVELLETAFTIKQ